MSESGFRMSARNSGNYNGLWERPWGTGGKAADEATVREEAAESTGGIGSWEMSQEGPSLVSWAAKDDGGKCFPICKVLCVPNKVSPQ